MKRILLFIVAVSSLAIYAGGCPNLSGQYECSENFYITVTQENINGVAVYTVSHPIKRDDATYTIIADGVERKFSNEDGFYGVEKYYCNDDILFSTIIGRIDSKEVNIDF